MKKALSATVVALSFITGISSCSKCQVCTKSSSPEVRICKNDYGSETEYGFALDLKKAEGYTCKASL